MSTYFLNLTAAILTGKGEWALAYNFTEAYNVPDVSAESIGQIAEQILNNNTEVFKKYFSFFTLFYNTDVTKCNDSCRIYQYCSIVAVDQDDHKICIHDNSMVTDCPPRMLVFLSFLLFLVILAITAVGICYCCYKRQEGSYSTLLNKSARC